MIIVQKIKCWKIPHKYKQGGKRVCVWARIIATSVNKREVEKMATQREQDAAEYLKKHKVIELMDNLTSMLFFYRPG